ncbi:hypothetical protein ADUPG1_013953 [Aduncisulcus paluster]|uniref:Uncharacterized protein n=1 Tax=Aduncisulcus paluster TaxID=2918883 RepID=A0ABQ5K502_9EUKA|nr:hypothetical protein ADUPG1_013953 [Aduncisulcus paluster]
MPKNKTLSTEIEVYRRAINTVCNALIITAHLTEFQAHAAAVALCGHPVRPSLVRFDGHIKPIAIANFFSHLSNEKTPIRIEIINNPAFKGKIAAKILTHLATLDVKEITLSGTRVGTRTMSAFSDAMVANKRILSKLEVSNNTAVTSKLGAKIASIAPACEVLVLRGTAFGKNGADAFGPLVKQLSRKKRPRLTVLDVRHCHLDLDGVAALADILRVNKSIEMLLLGKNKVLRDKSAKIILEALEFNPGSKIRYIELDRSEKNEKVFKALSSLIAQRWGSKPASAQVKGLTDRGMDEEDEIIGDDSEEDEGEKEAKYGGIKSPSSPLDITEAPALSVKKREEKWRHSLEETPSSSILFANYITPAPMADRKKEREDEEEESEEERDDIQSYPQSITKTSTIEIRMRDNEQIDVEGVIVRVHEPKEKKEEGAGI